MLQINGATDRGMVREANEDRFAGEVFDRSSGYAVVCDGMGGAAGGGIAAGIAAEEVRRMVESSLRPHMEERSVHLLLESAVANANRAVYTRSEQAGGALCGMGTTLCAAVICDGTALVANIGDSRCYLLREDRLTQVTEDHTAVSAMIRLGLLTPEEAQGAVSARLTISGRQLCLIPTQAGERLCYEFQGTYGGASYLCYINAETGKQEELLKIVESSAGLETA